MIKLYDNAFSPFARKVRMVLEHQGLNFEAIDGLLKSNHALERDLADREFVSGPLSIADMALFPHLAGAKPMEVEFSAQEHPKLAGWFRQMRALPICAADLRRARDYVTNLNDRDIERWRIFWRGDRIEWMLVRGFYRLVFRGDQRTARFMAGAVSTGTNESAHLSSASKG